MPYISPSLSEICSQQQTSQNVFYARGLVDMQYHKSLKTHSSPALRRDPRARSSDTRLVGSNLYKTLLSCRLHIHRLGEEFVDSLST